MTIDELIDQLKTYPPKAIVELNDPEGTTNYFHIRLGYTSETNIVEIYGRYNE